MSQDLSNLVAAFSTGLRFQDGHSPAPLSSKHDSCFLKMKGLPFTASKSDVEQFFSGYVVKDVQFVCEPDGRQTGLAFAEFETPEEAARALTKNGEYIGTRYIKLLLVSREEVEHSLQEGATGVPFAAASRRAPRAQAIAASNPVSFLPPAASLAGWPAQAVPDRLALGSSAYVRRPFRPVQPGAPAPWSAGIDMHGAMLQVMPQRPVLLPTAPEPMPAQPLGSHFPIELLDMQGGNFTFSPLSNTRTLRIRGLPYTVRPDEVISFFDGLNALGDTLQFAYDPMGRFTGDAWISFATPDNALEALKQKNRHYLRNRYLELSLC